MDVRWQPTALDSKGDVKVILHPTASITSVRRGTAADGVDLSPYVEEGSQSVADCSLTLKWNTELDGANQPKPFQVLEIQLGQGGLYYPVWIGIVEDISNYVQMRGEQSMQLIARSRDSFDIWRTTKRVTPLYPQMTDIAYIARQIGKNVGLTADEIVFPMSSFTTSHTNTQLADMSAWEMLTDLFLPMGWTPFMDGLGRLRAANRELQGRVPDIVVSQDRLVRVTSRKGRASVSRVRVKWLDPVLKKARQQGRKLADAIITTGWFIPHIHKTVYFSDDKTQRAEATYLDIKQSANALIVPVCREKYHQLTQNEGRIELTNLAFAPAIVALGLQWYLAHNVPDHVITDPISGEGVTNPTGRRLEAAAQLAFILIVLSIGTGIYEVWGTPYDWVHARNTTEAYAKNLPDWVDNPMEIESDFIMNEPHAQAVAVRELIYQYKSSQKWGVTLVDDPRIEYGDILELPGPSKMFVEDFRRPLKRGEAANLDVTGFLI